MAAFKYEWIVLEEVVSTHSHPKVAAGVSAEWLMTGKGVSTHSHPKVAAGSKAHDVRLIKRFNTQPPEGGCSLYKKMIKISKLFTVFRYPLKHKEYQEV